ncbi:MAG: PepSY domain-containing protein [Muribaculaceae bacterium]|nr:PepSY domain-containing protein [Muribaculaceae bacterium]
MKIFRKIHLWISVPFGIIITLICFSGAMLIFEPEITRSVKSDVYYVGSSNGTPLPMSELMETVKATLPDSVSITGVTVFSDKDRTYQVNLSKPRRASLFIDQYSGEITGKYERLGFFSTMFKLHRWLLDSANPHGDGVQVGKLLVGISTLVFVIALISGVIIWWPRARKSFRRNMTISFKDGWRGLWKSLHIAGGMYALIFMLAMSLTGLTWSFNWYRAAFYAVCGVEHTPRNACNQTAAGSENRDEGRSEGRGEGRRDEGRRHHSEFGRWQQVYETLRAQNHEAPQITVGEQTASVSLGTTGNGRASDKYEFNRRSGEVTPESKYADSLPADKLRGWIYSVHTGGWGGIVTRILWFLSALLGASLPLTGYYIWLKHLGKKKAHHTATR